MRDLKSRKLNNLRELTQDPRVQFAADVAAEYFLQTGDPRPMANLARNVKGLALKQAVDQELKHAAEGGQERDAQANVAERNRELIERSKRKGPLEWE